MNESYTAGEWQVEKGAAEAFDAFILRTGLFHVHGEVRGTHLQPLPGQNPKGMRIDRILSPTQKLLDAGWNGRTIGVEFKKSGLPIGRAIAQMEDYRRSAWHCHQVSVFIDFCF